MNPLQGSGVSARSRCGAVPILELADEPSTGIARVGSLAGEPSCGDRCGAVRILELADEPSTGDRVCRSALAVVPCESLSSPMNLLQGSGVSQRSRCGAVPILEPCESLSSPMNPLQGSGVSDRSPANPLRGSVWCRANP